MEVEVEAVEVEWRWWWWWQWQPVTCAARCASSCACSCALNAFVRIDGRGDGGSAGGGGVSSMRLWASSMSLLKSPPAEPSEPARSSDWRCWIASSRRSALRCWASIRAAMCCGAAGGAGVSGGRSGVRAAGGRGEEGRGRRGAGGGRAHLEPPLVRLLLPLVLRAPLGGELARLLLAPPLDRLVACGGRRRRRARPLLRLRAPAFVRLVGGVLKWRGGRR